MLSYERVIQIFEGISQSLGLGFMHGRDFDMNTYEGEFPLVFMYPMSFRTDLVSGERFNVSYKAQLVFMVLNADGYDRSAESDLLNVYECDVLFSKFLEKIRLENEIISLQVNCDTIPLYNKSAFCGTVINANFEIKGNYKIIC